MFASRILEEISITLCISDWISEQRMTKLNHTFNIQMSGPWYLGPKECCICPYLTQLTQIISSLTESCINLSCLFQIRETYKMCNAVSHKNARGLNINLPRSVGSTCGKSRYRVSEWVNYEVKMLSAESCSSYRSRKCLRETQQHSWDGKKQYTIHFPSMCVKKDF